MITVLAALPMHMWFCLKQPGSMNSVYISSAQAWQRMLHRITCMHVCQLHTDGTESYSRSCNTQQFAATAVLDAL